MKKDENGNLIIRSTEFSSYNTCPYKYKLQSENRLNNQHFEVGTAVHKVLSLVPEMFLQGDESWDELLVKELKQFSWCSLEIIEKMTTTLKVGVENIIKTIEEGYQIQTEIPLKRALPSGIIIQGTADRIDTNSNTFRIVDYKTGAWVPSKQDMMGDFQLLIYSFLTQDLASVRQRVEISLFSLGRGVAQTVTIPMEVEAIIESIIEERALVMSQDNEFCPNPSSMCGYCEFSSLCAFWRKFKNNFELTEDTDELARTLGELIQYKNGVDGVISQFKEQLERNLIKNNLTEVEINSKITKLSQTVSNRNGEISVSKPFIRLPK